MRNDKEHTWTVVVSKSALKHLHKIPKTDCKRIKKVLLQMEISPISGDTKKLIKEEKYRRRVGKYRILFELFADTVVVYIVDVLKRDERTYQKKK